MNIWRQWWVREVVVITDATLRSEKGWTRTRRLRSLLYSIQTTKVNNWRLKEKKVKRSHNIMRCYYEISIRRRLSLLTMVQSCKVNDLCFRAIDVKQQSTHTVYMATTVFPIADTGNLFINYHFFTIKKKALI